MSSVITSCSKHVHILSNVGYLGSSMIKQVAQSDDILNVGYLGSSVIKQVVQSKNILNVGYLGLSVIKTSFSGQGHREMSTGLSLSVITYINGATVFVEYLGG